MPDQSSNAHWPKPVRYDRPQTGRERAKLADWVAAEAECLTSLARQAALWCDLVAQEVEARLGVGAGDEDQEARLGDPAYNEALDRFGELEVLARTAREAAERLAMPGQDLPIGGANDD